MQIAENMDQGSQMANIIVFFFNSADISAKFLGLIPRDLDFDSKKRERIKSDQRDSISFSLIAFGDVIRQRTADEKWLLFGLLCF